MWRFILVLSQLVKKNKELDIYWKELNFNFFMTPFTNYQVSIEYFRCRCIVYPSISKLKTTLMQYKYLLLNKIVKRRWHRQNKLLHNQLVLTMNTAPRDHRVLKPTYKIACVWPDGRLWIKILNAKLTSLTALEFLLRSVWSTGPGHKIFGDIFIFYIIG